MSLSERRAAQLLTALDSVVRTVRHVAAKDHGQTMTGTLSGILKAVSATDLRPGDLAAHLMVAPSVASRAVAALEADGLVERHLDPDDARASLIGITDLGRDRLAEHRSYTLQRVVAALPDWDDEEAALATQVLSRLDLSLAAAPTTHPLPGPKVLAGSTAITLLDQMESTTV
ncbi:MAG: MarR family winged helix-turn-helix transcriptional regulator [Janthinobacterium lividum]